MTQAPSIPGQADPLDVARRTLARYIADKGLKSTRQRDLIAETFLSQGEHLRVEQLLKLVRTLDSRVSAATVYRTMKLLSECGLASQHHFGDGQTCYEPAVGRHHHDHLICTRCHAIIEFESDRIEALQGTIARRHGFLVTHHRLELYGLCAACLASGAVAEPEKVKEKKPKPAEVPARR